MTSAAPPRGVIERAPPPLAETVGLSPAEHAAIAAGLGRAPNAVEIRCFGVLWSEHCAYKHSRQVLRRLPSTGPGVLQGPGENAGVVAIGGGWAVVFKMESHNHPSAVDPYNGAATGVGGIIRDVLAMGARPIALLDSLRFGPLTDARTRRLLAGVVGGIAGYGNSIGVPTVGGELAVDPAYRDNPLVNVACLGLVRVEDIARARADPPGAVLLYAGARTGRDGIGGAAFASDVLDKAAEQEDRSAVQIGDPFAGKCLIEATLEALGTGRVLGLQDMGAGGLACAAAEMAGRAGRGVTLDLDRVPRRERGMPPHEVLLSESQERMLLVVLPEDASPLASVYRRRGLDAEVVGRVTSDGRFTVRSGGAIVADVPVTLLTQAPARRTAARRPVPPPRAADESGADGPAPDAGEVLLQLLATPEVASKAAIYEQYDHMVQVRTAVRPGRDAAVLRLPEAPPLGLALAADGNGRWCAVDPYGGAAASVLEAAANLACVGAEPVAMTDCLNFARPEDPEVFWTFAQAVEGLADAARALGVPVVGGNVSFYNEGPAGHILPTPVVAMVGVIPHLGEDGHPPEESAPIVLIGEPAGALGGSLYAREVWDRARRTCHRPDLEGAPRTLACVRQAVRRRLLALAHDVSDGGVAVAVAETCLALNRGATIILPEASGDMVLFGEGGTRFIGVVAPERLFDLEALAREHAVPLVQIGHLEGRRLRIRASGRAAVDLSLRRLRRAWTSLSREDL